MNSDVTTSNPGVKPGLEILGFTDTSPNVIGVAYLVDQNRIRLFIKTDHLYFGKAEELKKQMHLGLNLLREILEPQENTQRTASAVIPSFVNESSLPLIL